MYELRIYHCRPGQFERALEGLRRNAGSLFVRHGFKARSFWQTREDHAGTRSIVYLLEWTDEVHRQSAWAALKVDPEWMEFLKHVAERGPAIDDVTTFLLEDAVDMIV